MSGLAYARDTRGRRLIGMIHGLVFRAKQRTITGNVTLTEADSGSTIFVGAADVVVTLPATIPGARYRFVLLAAGLSAGTGLSISPNASDKIMGNGFTSADDKDAILAGAGDREGDTIEIEGDKAGDGWVILDVIGTWTRQA